MSCHCNNHHTYTSTCHDCVTTQCGCQALLSSDCVNNVTAVFTNSEIETGLTLTETLEALDAYIQDLFGTITNYFALVNVGSGVEIYLGVNLLGQKKIRTLISLNNIITIVENGDTLDFDIVDANLLSFVQANQTTSSVANVGTGAQVFKNTTVVGNNTQYNFRSVIHDPQAGTGETPIRDIQQNTNDITIRSKKFKSAAGTIIVSSNTTEINLETLAVSSPDGSIDITTTATDMFLQVNPAWLDEQISAWVVNHSSTICDIVDNCGTPPTPTLGNFGYSATVSSDACDDACSSTNLIARYRDVADTFYEVATVLSTNIGLTVMATAGYYAEEGIVRYWNGTNFVGAPEVCGC